MRNELTSVADLGEGTWVPPILGKKGKIIDRRKAGRASKTTPPPSILAQGLDPPLNTEHYSNDIVIISRECTSLTVVNIITLYMSKGNITCMFTLMPCLITVQLWLLTFNLIKTM